MTTAHTPYFVISGDGWTVKNLNLGTVTELLFDPGVDQKELNERMFGAMAALNEWYANYRVRYTGDQ